MNGIVALQPGLFPDIKNVFFPMESLDKVCERFNNNFLCHKRINHFPTCQVSLLSNHTRYCSLKIAAPKVRYSFGSFNFLFFQKPTESLVECPEKHFMLNTMDLLILRKYQSVPSPLHDSPYYPNPQNPKNQLWCIKPSQSLFLTQNGLR